MAPQRVPIRNEDNRFQRLEVLKRNRRKRQRYKEFLVEGVRPINRMLEFGWTVVSFAYTPERPLSRWAQSILTQSSAQYHYELTKELMDKLSDKEDTSELLATVAIPADQLSRIVSQDTLLVVLFDRPASPGNLGTVIRSCESFKVNGLVITGHSADLYDPQTIRSSVGSLFALPTIRVPANQDLLPWLASLRDRYADLQVVGSSARTDHDIVDADFTKPTVFMVGNETDGLSANLKALCDDLVRIPIYGTATSLNVACAASIGLYEIDRQRRA